jgi:hypothetical protein
VDAYFELKTAILRVNFNKVKEKLKNIKIPLALTKLRCILIMLKRCRSRAGGNPC